MAAFSEKSSKASTQAATPQSAKIDESQMAELEKWAALSGGAIKIERNARQ